MQWLFSATLFLSAALLFLVQPMIAKMVLPLLGGTPAVWNTCMVFFQAALLAGYAYAHGLPGRLGVRRHAFLHLVLLLTPFLVLPFTIGEWAPSENANPILWLLVLLTVVVGLPFFVLSTNAPLIQLWFAATGRRSSSDPYFLYAASNLGSMLALLSYPILLEPNYPLAFQARIWTIGYGILVLAMLGCAVVVWRAPRAASDLALQSDYRPPANDGPLTTHPTLTRLRWVALAFVPSSLMLSVTEYLTTDIAAIPLLWVIPLAIYLLTFTLAFARRPLVPHRLLVRTSPLVVLLLAIVMLTQATEPIWILVPLHLLAFYVLALVCHGQLAAERPGVHRLTEFYLWLAVGGVLGGIFNALAAPLLFPAVVEYPLVLVLACILRPRVGHARPEETPVPELAPKKGRKESRQPVVVAVPGKPNGRNAPRRKPAVAMADAGVVTKDAATETDGLTAKPSSLRRWVLDPLTFDLFLPLVLGLLAAGLIVIVQALAPGHGSWRVGLMFAPPAVLCYTFLERPLRFGLGIGALLLAGTFYMGAYGGKTIYRERSFYETHRVTRFDTDDGHEEHVLVNGNTIHGRQNLDPRHRREPLTYYHRTGPIGQVFASFSGPDAKKEVALVGLGAGALAAYGQPGQHFTFYEIDPAVVHISRDLGFFTFLADSQAQIDYVLGDARLTLRKAADHRFGMIVMDAFSSDSIPLHLLTREAIQLYLQKLADDGLLVFHLSNRYLDLEPVLDNLAQDADLVCWSRYDQYVSEHEKKIGKTPSIWLVMAHRQSDLGKLTRQPGWVQVQTHQNQPVWTDDFSNLFSVFIWGRVDD